MNGLMDVLRPSTPPATQGARLIRPLDIDHTDPNDLSPQGLRRRSKARYYLRHRERLIKKSTEDNKKRRAKAKALKA